MSKSISNNIDFNRKKILISQKKEIFTMLNNKDWDNIIYMPWPRYDPLPGFFGVARRLNSNYELINNLTDNCISVNFYSSSYGNEVVNYFINLASTKFTKNQYTFNLIPDGFLNVVKHPITITNLFLGKFKFFRRFFNKQLRYTFFKSDRLGAGEKFLDKIYVLDGLNNEYNREITAIVPSFNNKVNIIKKSNQNRNALVIGQPLIGFKLMNKNQVQEISNEIENWLLSNKIDKVFYKSHPKDKNYTLCKQSYSIIGSNIFIEEHLMNVYYNFVIGVHSSVLLFAKQIYLNECEVLSFGWKYLRFKNLNLKKNLNQTFDNLNIKIIS